MKKKLYVAYPRGFRLSHECVENSFNRMVDIAKVVFNTDMEVVNDCDENVEDTLLEFVGKETLKLSNADFVICVDTLGYGADAFDTIFSNLIHVAFMPYQVCILPSGMLKWIAPDLYDCGEYNNTPYAFDESYLYNTCPDSAECEKPLERVYNDIPTCSICNDNQIEGQLYFDLDAMFDGTGNEHTQLN